MSISKKENEKLDRRLEDISDRLDKLTSFRYNFFLSLMKGVGSVIGGTIVVALLFGVLSRALEALGGFPYLEELLKR
jgi:Na+/H+ antiporter NhaC